MPDARFDREEHEAAAALFEKGDYGRALDRYRELAERGSTYAQVFLGWMYHVGRGVEKDPDEAHRWYQRAADADSADGQFYLGILQWEKENYRAAVEWLEKAASRGHLPALVRLGDLYLVGAGVGVDRERAYRLFEEAARGGHLVAQREIAVRMIKGELGVMRIPQGLYALARVLWRVARLASKDPQNEKLRH